MVKARGDRVRAAYRFAVPMRDGRDFPRGAGDEEFIGGSRLSNRDRALLHGDLQFLCTFQQYSAGDSWQYLWSDGTGDQSAGDDDEKVARRTFGDVAVVNEKRLIRAGGDGVVLGQDIGKQRDRFDPAAIPAIVHGGQQLCGWRLLDAGQRLERP